MTKDFTKEQAIRCAQHLDLIYSQSITLYDLIPNYPQPYTNVSHTNIGPHADGVVGSTSSTTVGQLTGKLGQMTISSNPSLVVIVTNSTPTPS